MENQNKFISSYGQKVPGKSTEIIRNGSVLQIRLLDHPDYIGEIIRVSFHYNNQYYCFNCNPHVKIVHILGSYLLMHIVNRIHASFVRNELFINRNVIRNMLVIGLGEMRES